MTTRLSLLIAQLADIAEAIAMWKAEIERLAQEADVALAVRSPATRLRPAVAAIAESIAAETEAFYRLVAEFEDIPGVREGQINGIGSMLNRLADKCATLQASLDASRLYIAA